MVRGCISWSLGLAKQFLSYPREIVFWDRSDNSGYCSRRTKQSLNNAVSSSMVLFSHGYFTTSNYIRRNVDTRVEGHTYVPMSFVSPTLPLHDFLKYLRSLIHILLLLRNSTTQTREILPRSLGLTCLLHAVVLRVISIFHLFPIEYSNKMKNYQKSLKYR